MQKRSPGGIEKRPAALKATWRGLELAKPLTTDLARDGSTYGGVAQLVERLLCKQRVVGSIPVASIGWVGWILWCCRRCLVESGSFPGRDRLLKTSLPAGRVLRDMAGAGVLFSKVNLIDV